MLCKRIKIFLIIFTFYYTNVFALLELDLNQTSAETCTIEAKGFVSTKSYLKEFHISFGLRDQVIVINNCNFLVVDKERKLIKIFGGFIYTKNCNSSSCFAVARKKKIDVAMSSNQNKVRSGKMDILDVINQNLNTTQVSSNKPFSISTKRAGKFLIAIDAGHGGKDPGSIGRRKTYEKDITLKYAKYLKTVLEEDGNMVYLVRDKDVYVKLHSRIDRAMIKNVDLFISIHADSAKNKNARGATIYALSPTAINDATNKAEKRNNISGNFLDNSNDKDLIFNILNLQHSASVKQSFQFAKKLYARLKNNGVNFTASPIRSANFAVLKAPLFPAILLEIGYISNWEDERMIKSNFYMNKVANSIKYAVRDIK
jgi:N-acetylmuramoyl-L-alanine amidase